MNPVGTNYPLPFWNRPNKLVTIPVTRLEWKPVFVNNMPVMDGITGKQVVEMQQVPVMEFTHVDKHGARHERPKLITCMAYIPKAILPLQDTVAARMSTHQSEPSLGYENNRMLQHACRMARQERRLFVDAAPLPAKPKRNRTKKKVMHVIAKSTALR